MNSLVKNSSVLKFQSTKITSKSIIYSTPSRSLYNLDALPYQYRDGTRPLYSGKALTVHYKQYLATTVNKANTLVTNTEYMDLPLVDTIRKSFLDAGQRALFNQCAEIWNHQFFFSCLKPRGALTHLDKENDELDAIHDKETIEPLRRIEKKFPTPTSQEIIADAAQTGRKPMRIVTSDDIVKQVYEPPNVEAMNRPYAQDLVEEINASFGSFEEFKKKFERYSKALGANGWIWLVDHQANLEVIATQGADNPLTKRFMTPLLCLDMWEHAFVLDYHYDTNEYLKNFWRVVNWPTVEKNWAKAKRSREMERELYDL